MIQTFVDVFPVFMIILAGWLTMKTGWLPPRLGELLGEAVFRLGVPVILFRTLANATFDHAAPTALWATYFTGVAVAWTAGHLAATRLFAEPKPVGVIAGISAAFANNVFIGLPLVTRLVGEEGAVAVSILLAIHLPVMMIAGTVLMERATTPERADRSSVLRVLSQTGRNLVRNPLVIGIALGSLTNGLSLPIPPPVDEGLRLVALAASPLALFSIGMTLKGGLQAAEAPLVIALSALKLFLLPAAVYAAAHLYGLPPSWTAAMVLTSSVPSGINAWLIATRFGQAARLAASTIFVTTLTGAATVSLWAWLLVP